MSSLPVAARLFTYQHTVHTFLESRGVRSQRSLLPYGDGVNLRAVPRNFPNGIPTIRRYAMAKALLPITDSDDPLTIAIPRQVIYSSRYNAVFALRGPLSFAIPHTNGPSSIARGNIIAGRTESGNSGRAGVASVLRTVCWVID